MTRSEAEHLQTLHRAAAHDGKPPGRAEGIEADPPTATGGRYTPVFAALLAIGSIALIIQWIR